MTRGAGQNRGEVHTLAQASAPLARATTRRGFFGIVAGVAAAATVPFRKPEAVVEAYARTPQGTILVVKVDGGPTRTITIPPQGCTAEELAALINGEAIEVRHVEGGIVVGPVKITRAHEFGYPGSVPKRRFL